MLKPKTLIYHHKILHTFPYHPPKQCSIASNILEQLGILLRCQHYEYEVIVGGSEKEIKWGWRKRRQEHFDT